MGTPIGSFAVFADNYPLATVSLNMGAGQTTLPKLPDHCRLASAQLDKVADYITAQMENVVEDTLGLGYYPSGIDTEDEFLENLRELTVLEQMISRVLVAIAFYHGLNSKVIERSQEALSRQATVISTIREVDMDMPNLSEYCRLATAHLENAVTFITGQQEHAVGDIMELNYPDGERDDEVIENLGVLNALQKQMPRVLVAMAFYRRLSTRVLRRSEEAGRRQASSSAQSGQR